MMPRKELTERQRERRAQHPDAGWRTYSSPRKTANNRKWNAINQDKHKAHRAVERALRLGILVRLGFCQLCLSGKSIEAHHPDYSHPLEIVWLCRTCHRVLEGRSPISAVILRSMEEL